MVLEETLRGFEGRWTEFHLGVVFHPDFQPVPYGVGLGSAVVDSHIFFDGFLQLFLDLGLRLAKNVLDDGLASFQIVTDRVPALPSAVLSFADVPLPVCSSFGIKSAPFDNEQYRNQGNKATEKRNRYQKVII